MTAPFVPGSAGAARTDAPPLSLPGEHFAAALAFLLAGSIALVRLTPVLAEGFFFLPSLAATTHLFTLGWITTSIMGALYQFLPVAVGSPFRSRPLAEVTFALHVLGVVALVVGLAFGSRALLHTGACSVALALSLFAGHLLVSLRRATERGVTYWALTGAAIFLVATLAFGFVLALNLGGAGCLGVHRFEFLAAHIHLAFVGWVLMVVVGVAHKLLPMFLLSHGASERPARVALVSLASGAALLPLPFGTALHVFAAVLVAAGVVAFIVQVASFVRHKKRPALDSGMRLALSGVVGLAIALGLAPFALTRGLADLHLLVAYVFVLLASVTLFVAGHYYKIVPFLIWYHRFGALVGKRKVPRVSELFGERTALVAAVSLVSGLASIGAAIAWHLPWLARAGALVFAVGVCLEAAQMVRIATRRPT